MNSCLLLPFILFWTVTQAQFPPTPILPCAINPIPIAHPDWNITFQLFQEAQCELTISPSNPFFLPVTALAPANNCTGSRLVDISLPSGIPNGLTAFYWQCTGQLATSCSLFDISQTVDNLTMYEASRATGHLFQRCLDSWEEAADDPMTSASNVSEGASTTTVAPAEGVFSNGTKYTRK